MGKFAEEETISAKDQHEMFSNSSQVETFTEKEFVEKWNFFLSKVESPNIKTSLSVVTVFNPDYKFDLCVENSVQEDNVRNIKPQLVSFLRKELKNSTIEIGTKIEERKSIRLIYSDDEKYVEMAQQNPALVLLRSKFNLDFGD
jgi:hypothetical protein